MSEDCQTCDHDGGVFLHAEPYVARHIENLHSYLRRAERAERALVWLSNYIDEQAIVGSNEANRRGSIYLQGKADAYVEIYLELKGRILKEVYK